MFRQPQVFKHKDHKEASKGGLVFPFLARKKTKLERDGELRGQAEDKQKPMKTSDLNETETAVFDPKKYRVIDPALELLGRKEYVRKSLKCGRVRFENILVPAEASSELVCEECEKVYAILRCDACEQVMCGNCADICHPRTLMGTKLHNHEVRDKIRPLNARDTSRINMFKPFALPACDVFEDDLQLVKDITKPGTLTGAANSPAKVGQVTKPHKFKAMDRVIFMDPASRKDSYGRVISDWDFVHGDVAPAIKRGYDPKNLTGNWYIVEFMGNIDQVGNISDILTLLPPPPPPIEFPVLEGLEDIPYRENYYLASKINTAVELNKILKAKGPTKHLISSEEEKEQIDRGDYYFLLPKIEKVDPKKSDVTKGLDGNELKLQDRSWSQKQTLDAALGYGNDTNARSEHLNNPQYIQRSLGVMIMPESELIRPEEKLEVLSRAKFAAIENIVERIFFKLTYRLMTQGFFIWKSKMAALKEYQFFFSARRIQAFFRRFRCRNVLEYLREEKEQMRLQKLKKFHSQFHYCEKQTPFSKTMDSKKFFETINYGNRYYFHLRRVIVKIMKFTDRKRIEILRDTVGKWRDAIKAMTTADNKIGHFDHHTIDVDAGDEVKAIAEFNQSMIKQHQQLKLYGAKAIGTDDMSYQNVANLPLSPVRAFGTVGNTRQRTTSTEDISSPSRTQASPPRTASPPEKKDGYEARRRGRTKSVEAINENIPVNIPPFHPRVGIELPALKPVLMPKTAEERLKLDRSRRLNYCSYKAYMEGPTDDSCWIIPGKLLIGKVPYKQMFKSGNVLQLSGILAGGINTVISLMPEQEEVAMEQEIGFQSIESSIPTALVGARATCGRSIVESEALIQEQNDLLSKIPHFYPSDPRYQAAHRDKLRCNARKKMAANAIEKAKAQLEVVPSSCDFLRLPLQVDAVPTIHDFLVLLWEIENRIAQGAVVFCYSKEGHGRVGLVAACILGRLYGLTHHEALFRVQNSHDSQKCEDEKLRPVVVNCPQLWVQRRMVEDVLALTNRIYDGVMWRSHSDPETTNAENHKIVRGSYKGLTHVAAAKPVVNDKWSVRFAIDLPKDVPRPPTLVSEEEKKALEDSNPPAEELFVKEMSTQLKNVVVFPPESRPDPANRPKLPLLRTINDVKAADE